MCRSKVIRLLCFRAVSLSGYDGIAYRPKGDEVITEIIRHKTTNVMKKYLIISVGALMMLSS